MPKTTQWANDLIALVFHGDAIANIADNAASAPITSLYLSLHTAEPGVDGDQSTDECAYTSYARAEVGRSSGDWDIVDNAVALAAVQTFPECTGVADNEVATHAGIGTASSGAGKLLWYGAISPNISISNGIAPQLGTGTVLTEV